MEHHNKDIDDEIYKYDDSVCDDSYNVESFEEFYESNIENEYDEYIMRKYLKVCSNCCELVSKNNIINNLCNLCNISELHSKKRSTSINASNNLSFIDKLMKNWDI